MPILYISRVDLGMVQSFVRHRIKIRDDIAEKEEKARQYKYDRLDFLQQYENKVKDMLRCGVAIVGRHDDTNAENYLGNTMTGVLRIIALELKRPWIVANEMEGRPVDGAAYQHYWRLRIPRNQKLKAIAAGLLLASDNHAADDKKVVVHEIHERSWQFIFVGHKGTALYEHWIGQCRNDPIFRIALDLPQNPNL